MSSTTGALLLLAAGLGSMGYVTYIAVSSENRSNREVTEILSTDREPVHVRFVTHESDNDLRDTLEKLQVSYRPESAVTKIALSEKLCEVHVLVNPGAAKPSEDFIARQVSLCIGMATEFKGKKVAY